MRRTFAFVIAFAAAAVGFAQNYTLDNSVISGGGGTSTNAQFSVTGTIGQPVVGLSSGGTYSLQSGYWAVITVIQASGAPVLDIGRTNGAVMISWTSQPGFGLEQNADLALTNAWATATGTFSTNGTQILFSVPPSGGSRFFRLHKPGN